MDELIKHVLLCHVSLKIKCWNTVNNAENEKKINNQSSTQNTTQKVYEGAKKGKANKLLKDT